MPAIVLATMHKVGKFILFSIWLSFVIILFKPSPLICVILALTPISVLIFRILNSISTRRRFIKGLKEQGYDTLIIQHPIRSIFKQFDGESFRIEKEGITYSVKLISGRKRKYPIAFYPDGHLEYIIRFGIRGLYYEYSKHYTFDYYSEHPKIIVVNPVPHKLHTFHEAKLVDLDNGDKVGEYKIYTATAFLRALELGYISRGTNV